MAEAEYDERNDPNSPNYAPDEDLPPPEEDPSFDDFDKPKKRRKRRKWPWVVLVLLLLLGLLVLLLPTIANTTPVRAFVLEKVNNQLNGTLEITDWSIGWSGNTEITGVRITQNGAQILAARRLFTELSLLDMVKGDWDLGTTVVEDLTFVFKQFPDGSNNFQKLPRWQPSGEPVTLPDLRGDVDVTFWGSITQGDGTLITLDRSHVNAKFDSINGPIAHDLDVTARIADASPGKLTAKGQVDLFENGQLDLRQLAAEESTELREFPLDSIAALLPADAPITTLKGLTSGKLQLKLQGTNEMFVQGDITSEDFAVGGRALAGDVLRDKLVTIAIPETRYDRATGRLRTRMVGSQSQPIVVKMKQLGSVTVAANVPLPAVANVLANHAPAADGRLLATADLELVAVNQLPNLLPLPPGLRITSGVLRYDAELLLDKQAARIKGQFKVSELGGIDRERREIYAEPIHLTFNGTSLGGEGAIPDLRDLKVSLTSGFASLQGGGESLARVNLTGNADLAKFRSQLGQFVELNLRQLAGEVVFNAASSGNLTTPGGRSAIDATITATNVVYQDAEQAEPINEPWARITAKGQLLRGEEQFVESITDAVVSAQTGSESEPTVDFHASGELLFPAPEQQRTKAAAGATAVVVRAPRFETRMSVDLASAQREFGALLNPLRERGLTFTQGLLIASSAGAYDGDTLTLAAFNAATQNVTLRQLVAHSEPLMVLSDYNSALDIANVLLQRDEAFSSVSAQQLDFTGGFASATVKDAQLRIAGTTPGAYVSPLDLVQKAAMTWNITDLPRAAAVAQAFMPETAEELEEEDEVAAEPGDYEPVGHPLEVVSGTLSGSLRVDRTNEGIALTVDEIAGQRIVLNRGKGRFGPEDISLKLAALVRTSPPGPAARPVTEQIQEIRVTQLGGDIAVANVALTEPIIIRDPAGMTQATGAIRMDGQVRTLSDLLRTLEYLPSDGQDPFAGAYSVTQRLSTQKQVIALAGQVNIQNFVAGRFRERLVRLSNDLQLDQAKKAMLIRSFTLNLQESQALSVKASGTIADYNTERRFENTRALVSYDAGKLPDLIRPLLDETSQDYIKTLRLAGVVRDEPFVIEGRYPVPQPASGDAPQRDPIQHVTAHGRLLFEAFEYEGLPGRNLVIPLLLDNGRLSTVYPSKDRPYPAPASFSRGALDVGGLQVHLAGNAIRFSSMRQNHKLLDRVVVNRAIVERYLGQAHPLFAGTDEARGILTLTVNELDRLPIGQRLMRPGRKEEGRAEFKLALTDLRLKTFFLGQVLGTLKLVQVEPDGTVRTSIPDASFAIERGVINSNLGLNLGGTVLGFRNGSVRLRDKQILSLSMLIPKNLIPALRNEPVVKEFIEVPVSGTLARPQFDIIKAAIQSSGISNPLDLIKRLQADQEGASGSDRIGTTPDRSTPQERQQPRQQPSRNQRPRGTIGRQPR